MSIFGQVWLWSIAAFVFGVLLTWILLVRPAQSRNRSLERKLAAAHAAQAAHASPPESRFVTRTGFTVATAAGAAGAAGFASGQSTEDRPESPGTKTFEPQSFEAQAFESQSFQPPSFEPQSFESQSFEQGPFDRQSERGFPLGAESEGAFDARGSSDEASWYREDRSAGSAAYADLGTVEPDTADPGTEYIPPRPVNEAAVGMFESLRPPESQPETAPPEPDHTPEPELAAEKTSIFTPLVPAEPPTFGEQEPDQGFPRSGPAEYTVAQEDPIPATAQPAPEPSAFAFTGEQAPPGAGEAFEDEAGFGDEAAFDDDAEDSHLLPKRQPRQTPPGGFEPPRPIQPSIRSMERREPTEEEESGGTGSLFEPAMRRAERAEVPPPPDEPQPPMPPPARNSPLADPSIPLGPFGPGSAMPRPGGGRPSDDYQVKASVTALRYCTDESPQFPRMVAEVWFRTAADAERVGFRPLN
jgi:hypothetical protein